MKFWRKKTEDSLIFLGAEQKIRGKKMNKARKNIWLEDSFLNFSDEELSKTGKNYIGLGLDNSQIAWFLIVILIFLGLLFVRAGHLQIVNGKHYLSLAEKNRLRILHVRAPRGIIYDKNEISLVKNIPAFSIFITPYSFTNNEQDKEKTLMWLEKSLTGFDYKESLEEITKIKPTAKEYYEPVLLLEGLDYEKALSLRIKSLNYSGVDIEVTPRREYLNNRYNVDINSLAHLIGYEGKINSAEYSKLRNFGYLLNDYIGKIGLEAEYENQLRGSFGQEQVEVDSSGRAIKIIAKQEMIKGDNLYLSIDLQMQAKLQQIIEKYLNKLGKKKASAIVMNPQNGKIYSYISLPSYDNNLFAQGISSDDFQKLLIDKNQPLFNRVISGEYPSGSTIKPVISVAALEEGIINSSSSFLSTGGIRIGQWFFPDWKTGGHGITNVYKALSESVNTFYYIIGGGYGDFEGLGVKKIKKYAELFGLNQLTGIDLQNEKKGFLPTPEWKQETKKEQWYIGDTYHLAIGQGDLLVTPLQVANFTAVFANKGKLFKPKLVDRYLDQKTGQIIKIEPEIIRQDFIQQKNIEIVRQGMLQSVLNGSSRILNSLPVSSGGKTGTAQWGIDKDPHAWFTCFAPFENAELVVTVLIEESGEGSAVAAPITYEFLSWYFREYKNEN